MGGRTIISEWKKEDLDRWAAVEISTDNTATCRDLVEALAISWRYLNEEYYAGRLRQPRLALGLRVAGSLGRCTRLAGGLTEIRLARGLVPGISPDWIRDAEPVEGSMRFIEDLLLRLTVRQFVLEVRGTEEVRHGGYGPLFAAQANRVGMHEGLAVVAARGLGRGSGVPEARHWPHCVRPKDYYGTSVTEALRALAGCRA
jgi:hypothetical protein